MEWDIEAARQVVCDAIRFSLITRAEMLERIEGEIKLSASIGGTALEQFAYTLEDWMYTQEPDAFNEVSIAYAPPAIGQIEREPVLHFVCDLTGERVWEDAVDLLQDTDIVHADNNRDTLLPN